MTKTLNQIICFFLHQNQNIFLEKNHTPPPFQVKWSFPYKTTYSKLILNFIQIQSFVAQLFFEIYKRGFLVWREHPILYTRYPLWSTVRLSVLYPDNPPIHNPVRTEQLSGCETWEVLQRQTILYALRNQLFSQFPMQILNQHNLKFHYKSTFKICINILHQLTFLSMSHLTHLIHLSFIYLLERIVRSR